MRTTRKHTRSFLHFLLTATYFFLFAIQFAGKFYILANFFVYSSRNLYHATVANPSQGNASPGASFLVLVHSKSLPDGLHLSLDKRYHGRQSPEALSSSFVFAAISVFLEERGTSYTGSDTFVSRNLPTTLLRGPPRA